MQIGKYDVFDDKIVNTEEGKIIPYDPNNIDYREYLQYCIPKPTLDFIIFISDEVTKISLQHYRDITINSIPWEISEELIEEIDDNILDLKKKIRKMADFIVSLSGCS
jgi:hypothetical protein